MQVSIVDIGNSIGDFHEADMDELLNRMDKLTKNQIRLKNGIPGYQPKYENSETRQVIAMDILGGTIDVSTAQCWEPEPSRGNRFSIDRIYRMFLSLGMFSIKNTNGRMRGSSNDATEEIPVPRIPILLFNFKFVLRRQTRELIFNPAYYDLVANYIESYPLRASKWTRRWLKFAFLFRAVMLIAGTIRAEIIDYALDLLPRRWRDWFRKIS